MTAPKRTIRLSVKYYATLPVERYRVYIVTYYQLIYQVILAIFITNFCTQNDSVFLLKNLQ